MTDSGHRPIRNMRASRSFLAAQRRYPGKQVLCYTRDFYGQRLGPYRGRVRGVSDNQVSSEDEGKTEFTATGLLVDIPELGRHSVYGHWPVTFLDVIEISPNV